MLFVSVPTSQLLRSCLIPCENLRCNLVHYMELLKQSNKMILLLTFACQWPMAVAGLSSSEDHFMGWYIEADTSKYRGIFSPSVSFR